MPVFKKVSFTCVFSPGTAALLKQMKDLPRMLYKVDIDVKDLQSNGGIQTVSVTICQCRNGVCMGKDRSASLGSLAWLAMLLPLILLLLLCEFHIGAHANCAGFSRTKPGEPQSFMLTPNDNSPHCV